MQIKPNELSYSYVASSSSPQSIENQRKNLSIRILTVTSYMHMRTLRVFCTQST